MVFRILLKRFIMTYLEQGFGHYLSLYGVYNNLYNDDENFRRAVQKIRSVKDLKTFKDLSNADLQNFYKHWNRNHPRESDESDFEYKINGLMFFIASGIIAWNQFVKNISHKLCGQPGQPGQQICQGIVGDGGSDFLVPANEESQKQVIKHIMGPDFDVASCGGGNNAIVQQNVTILQQIYQDLQLNVSQNVLKQDMTNLKHAFDQLLKQRDVAMKMIQFMLYGNNETDLRQNLDRDNFEVCTRIRKIILDEQLLRDQSNIYKIFLQDLQQIDLDNFLNEGYWVNVDRNMNQVPSQISAISIGYKFFTFYQEGLARNKLQVRQREQEFIKSAKMVFRKDDLQHIAKLSFSPMSDYALKLLTERFNKRDEDDDSGAGAAMALTNPREQLLLNENEELKGKLEQKTQQINHTNQEYKKQLRQYQYKIDEYDHFKLEVSFGMENVTASNINNFARKWVRTLEIYQTATFVGRFMMELNNVIGSQTINSTLTQAITNVSNWESIIPGIPFPMSEVKTLTLHVQQEQSSIEAYISKYKFMHNIIEHLTINEINASKRLGEIMEVLQMLRSPYNIPYKELEGGRPQQQIHQLINILQTFAVSTPSLKSNQDAFDMLNAAIGVTWKSKDSTSIAECQEKLNNIVQVMGQDAVDNPHLYFTNIQKIHSENYKSTQQIKSLTDQLDNVNAEKAELEEKLSIALKRKLELEQAQANTEQLRSQENIKLLQVVEENKLLRTQLSQKDLQLQEQGRKIESMEVEKKDLELQSIQKSEAHSKELMTALLQVSKMSEQYSEMKNKIEDLSAQVDAKQINDVEEVLKITQKIAEIDDDNIIDSDFNMLEETIPSHIVIREHNSVPAADPLILAMSKGAIQHTFFENINYKVSSDPARQRELIEAIKMSGLARYLNEQKIVTNKEFGSYKTYESFLADAKTVLFRTYRKRNYVETREEPKKKVVCIPEGYKNKALAIVAPSSNINATDADRVWSQTPIIDFGRLNDETTC